MILKKINKWLNDNSVILLRKKVKVLQRKYNEQLNRNEVLSDDNRMLCHEIRGLKAKIGDKHGKKK